MSVPEEKKEAKGGDGHGKDPYLGMKMAAVGVLLAFIVFGGQLLTTIGIDIYGFANAVGRAWENNKTWIYGLIVIAGLLYIIKLLRGDKGGDGHH